MTIGLKVLSVLVVLSTLSLGCAGDSQSSEQARRQWVRLRAEQRATRSVQTWQNYVLAIMSLSN